MEVLNYIQSYASYTDDDGIEHKADMIWGISAKPMPENVLEVVVVATGFTDDEPMPRQSIYSMPVLEDVKPIEEDIIVTEPVNNPVTNPTPAPIQPRHQVAMPAVLDRKPSKYANIDAELRIPSYKRRNFGMVVKNDDNVARRKEIVRDEVAEPQQEKNDNTLFNA
jgi:hypothetical protein